MQPMACPSRASTRLQANAQAARYPHCCRLGICHSGRWHRTFTGSTTARERDATHSNSTRAHAELLLRATKTQAVPRANSSGVDVSLQLEYDIPGCCALVLEGQATGDDASYAAKLALYYSHHLVRADLLHKTVTYFARTHPGELHEGALNRVRDLETRGEQAAALIIMDYEQLKVMAERLVPDEAKPIIEQVWKASGREASVASSSSPDDELPLWSSSMAASGAAVNGPSSLPNAAAPSSPASSALWQSSRGLAASLGMSSQAAREALADLLISWAWQSPEITKKQVGQTEVAKFVVRARTSTGQRMLQSVRVGVSGAELPVLRDQVRAEGFVDSLARGNYNPFKGLEPQHIGNTAVTTAVTHLHLDEPEGFRLSVAQEEDQLRLSNTGTLTIDDDQAAAASEATLQMATDPNVPVTTPLDSASMASIDLADFSMQGGAQSSQSQTHPASMTGAVPALGGLAPPADVPSDLSGLTSRFHVAGTASELKMLALALQEYLCDSLGVMRGTARQLAWFPADARISLQWFPLADDTTGRGLTKVPGVHRLRVREDNGFAREAILSNGQLQGLMHALDLYLSSTPGWHDSVYPPPPIDMPPYRPAVFAWLRPLAAGVAWAALAGVALLPFAAAFYRQRSVPRLAQASVPAARPQLPSSRQGPAHTHGEVQNDEVTASEMKDVCSTIHSQIESGWVPSQLDLLDARVCNFQVVVDADTGSVCGCQPLNSRAVMMWADLPLTAAIRPATYQQQYATWQQQLMEATRIGSKVKVKASRPRPAEPLPTEPSRPVVLMVSVRAQRCKGAPGAPGVAFAVDVQPWQAEDSLRNWGCT